MEAMSARPCEEGTFMTGSSPADRVYGDGTLPADADFIAPAATTVNVRSSPGSQSGAESTTTTNTAITRESKKRRKND